MKNLRGVPSGHPRVRRLRSSIVGAQADRSAPSTTPDPRRIKAGDRPPASQKARAIPSLQLNRSTRLIPGPTASPSASLFMLETSGRRASTSSHQSLFRFPSISTRNPDSTFPLRPKPAFVRFTDPTKYVCLRSSGWKNRYVFAWTKRSVSRLRRVTSAGSVPHYAPASCMAFQ